MAAQHKHVSLNIFIDDIVIDTMSDDRNEVVQRMRAATEALAFIAQDKCMLKIAPEKSAVLSNSIPIAGLVRRCLKGLGGPPLGSVRSLGIDFWAAALKNPPMAVRRSRLARAARRKPRLSVLKRSNPLAAAKVYVCGVMPSVLYDTPVYGLFGRSLTKLRREAAFFCGQGGRKRSLDLCFAFGQNKDPEVLSSVAVVSRFSGEIWNASLPVHVRDSAGLSLGTLACGIKGYVDTNIEPPSVIQGPISAFHKTIAKAGWSFLGPFLLSTREGGKVDMRVTCPRKIVQLFRNDLCDVISLRTVQRKVKANPDAPPELHNILSEGLLLKPLTDMAKHLNAGDRQTLIAIVTDGIFTNSDLMWMGYDIDPVCRDCNNAVDSAFHRCSSCPNIEVRARLALGDELFDSLIAQGEHCALASTLWMARPRMESSPSREGEFKFINTHPGDPFLVKDGAIFGDGSVMFPNIQCLARAGFAIAQLHGDGTLNKAIYASLPDSMDQTAINAEYAAFALAAHAGERGSVYVGDCSAVINAYAQGAQLSMGGSNSHACVWKASDPKIDLADAFSNVLKTKAHRSLKDVPDDDDDDALFLFHGNECVDGLAKQAAGLHPPVSDDVRGYHLVVKNLKAIAYHMIDVLGVLRMSRLEEANAKRLPNGMRHRLKKGRGDDHEFMWVDPYWYCSKCLLRTNNPSVVGQSRRKCIGNTPFDKLLLDPKGHKLHVACVSGGGVFLFCNVCFCYANPHPRRLCEPCGGTDLNNSSSRFYIAKGKHPISRKALLCQRRVPVSA